MFIPDKSGLRSTGGVGGGEGGARLDSCLIGR